MDETTEFSVCTSSSVKYLNKDNSYWANPMASLGEMTPGHHLVRKRLLNALLSKRMIRTFCKCKGYGNSSGTWLQLIARTACIVLRYYEKVASNPRQTVGYLI